MSEGRHKWTSHVSVTFPLLWWLTWQKQGREGLFLTVPGAHQHGEALEVYNGSSSVAKRKQNKLDRNQRYAQSSKSLPLVTFFCYPGPISSRLHNLQNTTSLRSKAARKRSSPFQDILFSWIFNSQGAISGHGVLNTVPWIPSILAPSVSPLPGPHQSLSLFQIISLTTLTSVSFSTIAHSDFHSIPLLLCREIHFPKILSMSHKTLKGKENDTINRLQIFNP